MRSISLKQIALRALFILALTAMVANPTPGYATGKNYDHTVNQTYSKDELVHAGHSFFGKASGTFAHVIESIFSKLGRPTAYIIGEEASGAFVAGLKYGEGSLHFKTGGIHKVYWQGPSIGFDFGGNVSRTMTLVYKLNNIGAFYNSYPGIEGTAYFVGGFAVNFQESHGIIVVPIRTGVGFRLGINMGYLKYSRRPTWNPF